MAEVKKIAKVVNINQILRATDLNPNTVKAYSERLEKICERVLQKTYDNFHWPSTKDAQKVFTKPDTVIGAVNYMFPTDTPVEKDNKSNVENRKAYFIAVKAFLREAGDKIKGVTEEIEDKYTNAMNENRDKSEENRDKMLPTRNMALYPDVEWKTLLQRRDAFWSNKMKTFNNLKAFLPIALYTYLPPRRLEYRLLKVYHKRDPANTDDINYIVVKQNEIVMHLDVFKTRWRTWRKKKTEILPRYTVTFPDELTKWTKEYIKKANIRDGDYLFTKDKGVNKGQHYDSPPFSTFLNDCATAVLGLSIGVDDFRHYYVTEVGYNYMDYTRDQLKQVAVSMGDKSIETNQSYRVARQKKVDAEAGPSGVGEEPAPAPAPAAALPALEELPAEEEAPREMEMLPHVEEPSNEILLDNLWIALKPVLLKMMK